MEEVTDSYNSVTQKQLKFRPDSPQCLQVVILVNKTSTGNNTNSSK